MGGQIGREPGEELPGGATPSGQDQPEPVVAQQPDGQVPVPRRLGMPDRLHRVPVPGRTAARRGAVQRGEHGRLAAAVPTRTAPGPGWYCLDD